MTPREKIYRDMLSRAIPAIRIMWKILGDMPMGQERFRAEAPKIILAFVLEVCEGDDE